MQLQLRGVLNPVPLLDLNVKLDYNEYCVTSWAACPTVFLFVKMIVTDATLLADLLFIVIIFVAAEDFAVLLLTEATIAFPVVL